MWTKTNNHPYQKLAYLAVPMAITQLITMGSSFLCMSMLSQLGHQVLAASALIFSISISVLVTSISILFALSLLIGHAYGEKDYLAVGSLLQQGWVIGALISLPTMFICWNIYPVLIFLGQDKELSRIVEVFFHASILRVPIILFSVANQQLCFGVNKQRIDMYANIAGVVVLLVSSYLLIFGKLGLPAFGVAGFGYASTLQSFFYFIVVSCCLYFDDYFKKFELFRMRFHKNWQSLKKLFKFGWPISLQISGEVICFSVIATFMGWLGKDSLSGYQIIMQYQFLIVVPVFAISQASGILIGQAYGGKQMSDINSYGQAGLLFVCVITALIGSLFLIIPKTLCLPYLDIHNPANAHIMSIAVLLFAVLAIAQFLDGIRNLLTGCLRGVLDVQFPMRIGLGALWLISLPIAYLFGFLFHWGAVGVMIGWTLGVGLGTVILAVRWFFRGSLKIESRPS